MTRSPAQAGLHRLVRTYVRSEGGTRFIPHDSNVAPSPCGCTSWCHRYDECRFGDAHHTQRCPHQADPRFIPPGSDALGLGGCASCAHASPPVPAGYEHKSQYAGHPARQQCHTAPLGGTVIRALCARCRSSGSVVPRVMRPSRASTRRHGVGSNATLPVSETASCSLVGRSAEVRRGNSPVWPNHSLDTSEDIYTSIAFIDMIHRSIAQYVDGRTDLHALTASVAL